MLPSNHSFFHIAIAILDFSLLLLVKLSLLILFAYFLVSVLCFFFDYSLSTRSPNYCDSNSCRSLSLLKAIAKRLPLLFANVFKSVKGRQLLLSQYRKAMNPSTKLIQKLKQKRLRATTFAIAKLEER